MDFRTSAASHQQQLIRQKFRNPPPKVPKGRLLITEIRIPFVWKERQYFRNRAYDPALNSGKKFVLFCILYTNDDMQSTQKVMIDSTMADIVFNELLEFSNITPATKLHIEVFSYACSNTGANKTASPVRKLSRKLSQSLTRAFGRRYAANPVCNWTQSSSIHADLHAAEHKQQQHQLPLTSLPNFTKIAEAVLPIDDLVSGEEGRSHILTTKTPQKGLDRNSTAAHQVPLFGSFCCRTAVQPYCATKEIQIGRVNIQQVSSNTVCRNNTPAASAQSFYCTLVNAYLYAYNADRDRRLLEMAIRVDSDTKIHKTPDVDTIEVVNQSDTHILTFPSEEERRYVANILRGHINELARWTDAALNVRDLKLKPNSAKSEIRRRGSLYDEIPVSMQTVSSASQIRY